MWIAIRQIDCDPVFVLSREGIARFPIRVRQQAAVHRIAWFGADRCLRCRKRHREIGLPLVDAPDQEVSLAPVGVNRKRCLQLFQRLIQFASVKQARAFRHQVVSHQMLPAVHTG